MTDDVQNKNNGDQLAEELGAQDEGRVVEQEESVSEAICKNCEKLQKECEEYKQGWQRALADYNNLQKETKERMSEWVQMSEKQILEEFIPVYDNFKKAFGVKEQGTWNKEQENWVVGIQYIMKQFGDVLKAHNVEEIKTIGEKFDPKVHESVGEEEVEGKESGEVVKEVDGGYKMGERVIKAARVVISK